MRYKAKYDKYENLSDDDLLYKLLKERGVENPKAFLNINETVINDAKLFKNMEKGLYLIDKYVLNGGKACIIVDSDDDGFMSSAFTYLELNHLNPELEISYILHEGKEHGIILNELNQTDYKFDILIVPDAGSLDIEQCKFLKEKGKDVLILDHHNFDKDNPYAILINCQDNQYPNNTLAGTGVVYKFFNLYEKLLGYDNFSDTMLDLVAMGNIGDSMDLRNFETRYLCLKGIDLLNMGKGNSFINALIEKQRKRIGDTITISKLSWNIVPQFNAVARVGTMEEKIDVFKALIESKETREYQPRRKNKNDPKPEIEIQSLQTFMARVCTNIKSRQDKLVTKGVELINEKIKTLHLNTNKIIMIDGTEELEKTFTGYVANKLADYYKRPILIYRNKKDNNVGGSGRNYDLFEMDNFRQVLLDTNEFNFVDGHDDAFGFEITKDKLNKIKNILNIKLIDVKIEDTYHVDYIIPIGRLREKHILQVGQWESMWSSSNKLKEPLFAITDVYVQIENIQLLGEKENVLCITKNIGNSQIKFIKLQNAKDTYNKILGRENSKGLNKRKSNKIGLEIIGRFKINEYNNNQYPQIEIVDFNVLEDRKITF